MTPVWNPEDAEQIRHMRYRMEETAKPANLKRGSGGTVDIYGSFDQATDLHKIEGSGLDLLL